MVNGLTPRVIGWSGRDLKWAVQAYLDLGPGMTIGMHFGTFQLTDEGIDEPARALRESLRERGVEEEKFRVPAFGETYLI